MRFPDRRIQLLFIPSLLSMMLLVVYLQVGHHSFINFDDQNYVYQNPRVLHGLTKKHGLGVHYQ
jgi:hypothetical protein